jgi:UPF0716 protein FxsA
MLALLLLIIWPIAELLVAIKVAETIGVLATVLLVLAGLPVGAWLLRTEGRGAWRRLGASVSAGRAPGHAVLDGALIVAGGFLLIVPGFISDVVGLVLLLGPTRSLARRGIVRNLRSRFVVRATQFAGGSRPYDVDSTAIDVDSAQLHR